MNNKLKPLPSVKKLRECFAYNPEIGILMWKDRPSSHFTDRGTYVRANSLTAGKIAGSPYGHPTRVTANLSLNGETYSVTRIIYKLVTGHEPNGYVYAHDCSWPYIPFKNIKITRL